MNTPKNLALLAFMAMGMEFATAKKQMIRAPLKMGERRKGKVSSRPAKQVLKERNKS